MHDRQKKKRVVILWVHLSDAPGGFKRSNLKQLGASHSLYSNRQDLSLRFQSHCTLPVAIRIIIDLKHLGKSLFSLNYFI